MNVAFLLATVGMTKLYCSKTPTIPQECRGFIHVKSFVRSAVRSHGEGGHGARAHRDKRATAHTASEGRSAVPPLGHNFDHAGPARRRPPQVATARHRPPQSGWHSPSRNHYFLIFPYMSYPCKLISLGSPHQKLHNSTLNQ